MANSSGKTVPETRQHDRRPSPIRSFFQSLRSSPGDSDATSPRVSSRSSQGPAQLTVPGSSGTRGLIEAKGLAERQNDILVSALSPPNTSTPYQLPSFNSTSAAQTSKSPTKPVNRPPGRTPSPQSRDPWGEAARAIDPQTLSKWKSSDPTLNTINGAQGISTVLDSAKG